MNPRPESHWTEDDFIQSFYGLKAEDEHVRSCTECASRVQKMAAVHAEVVRPPEVPPELLAEQRRRIHQRMELISRGWHPLRWAGALAAMAALVFVLLLHRSNPPGPLNDPFFTEVSAMDQNPAPRAIQPIEALVGDDNPE